MTLKQIVDDTDTLPGKAFDLTIQALILYSLICFCIDTLPNLPTKVQAFLNISEVVVVLLFTVEYALRLLVADHPLRFFFSFYGLVDLVAFLPFYFFAGIDLRAVRILRLFRVFRIFKLLRYTKALHRMRDAVLEIREELVLYGMVTGLTIFLASVGIYYFESGAQPERFGSMFHCLWWSIVTLTTVGYGDAYPVTAGGRFFTAFVLMAGVGIVAIPSGLFASALMKTRKKDE